MEEGTASDVAVEEALEPALEVGEGETVSAAVRNTENITRSLWGSTKDDLMSSIITNGLKVRRRHLCDKIGAGIQKTLLHFLGGRTADALEISGVFLGIDASKNTSLKTALLAKLY